MANSMRQALEDAGFKPSRRFPEKTDKTAERKAREERQAADAVRLSTAREGLAAMTKKDDK